MISINFFGTHDFAAGILQALHNSGLFEIKNVFSAPDKPVGRHQELQSPPVKILAQKLNLNILQPTTLKNFDFQPYAVDLNIVCQYGFIIPKNILDGAKFQSINVHTSLLPKYRGAAPIQTAIINGDTETGVTIMLMDEKMDHGPILNQEKVTIEDTDNHTTLAQKLLEKAIFTLLDTAPKWVVGNIQPVSQNENEATYCKPLSRNDGKINFTEQTVTQIYNLYRALTPWPGIWTELSGKRIKFITIQPVDRNVAPGKIEIENEKIFFGCKNGAIEVLNLQLEGKKAMGATIFLNGYRTLLC